MRETPIPRRLSELWTAAYQYANSSSGTVVPTSWSDTRPATTPGTWSWTKTVITFDTGSTTTLYSAAYQGQDGQGTPGSSTPLPDAATGETGTASAYSREDHVHPSSIYEVTVNVFTASTTSQIGSATDARINSNFDLVREEIAEPNYQSSDWVVTTYDTEPQVRIVGTATGETSVKLIFAPKNQEV